MTQLLEATTMLKNPTPAGTKSTQRYGPQGVCLNFNREGTHAVSTPVDHATRVATAEGTVMEHTNANGRSHQTTASSH